MGHHLITDSRSRFEKTDPRWLKAGAQLNDVVNTWASRGDIVTFVGEGAANGSAGAAFNMQLSEMEINVTAAFGEGCDPKFVGDLTDRDVQFDYPPAMGAVLHEAMHAKHTKHDLQEVFNKILVDQKKTNPLAGFEYMIVTDLEETRIEARGVAAWPQNRSFLRACALKLVLGDIKEDADFADRGHQSMSKLMLLSMARVSAGVLDEADIKPISDAAYKLYGEDLVGKLRALWERGQAVKDDHDWRPLWQIAKEWIKLLKAEGHDPESEQEIPEWLKELLQAMAGSPGGGEGSGEDGEGDGEGESEGDGSEGEGQDDGEGKGSGGKPGILEAMADAIETAARTEANGQAVQEQSEEMAKAASEKAAERASDEAEAAKVFGRGTGPGPFETNSRLIEKRKPEGRERAAAVRLAKDLERARYRDRVVTERKGVVPPGRLQMRAAMAGSEQRSRGAVVTAEPWRRKVRHMTEDPKLKIGVLVDISGSMSRAMEPMAVAAWVLSEAGRRIQAEVAEIYFGNDVFPVLAPGQHLDEINVYSAADGTERFRKAWKALQGKLDLLNSTGARLLVVVSDLYHNGSETQAETEVFARCKREGVAVIVVAPEPRMVTHAQQFVKGNGTVLAMDHSDPAAMARMIGEAAVKELQAAGSRW